MNWRFVNRLTTLPFFHYSGYVVIGVPLLAELFNELHPYFPAARFPHLLAIGFSAGVLWVFAEVTAHLACPPIMKEYKSQNSYVDAEAKNYEEAQERNCLNVVITNLEPSEKDLGTRLRSLLDAKDLTTAEAEAKSLYPTCVKRFLRKEYERESKSRLEAAWTTTVLYVLGIGLALWVMYGRIDAVVEAMHK